MHERDLSPKRKNRVKRKTSPALGDEEKEWGGGLACLGRAGTVWGPWGGGVLYKGVYGIDFS